jgi:hypothetical protein
MVLWTDIVDPATLTGYARAALEDYEQQRGTLARWLPNRMIADIVARFVKGQTGLLEISRFRAFDAEIGVGERAPKQRVTLELPALGDTVPVSEYEQLRARGGNPSDEAILANIQDVTRQQVQKTADAQEFMRGVVLNTGKATIAELGTADDFGRSSGHSTAVAATLWSATTPDPLSNLQAAADTYNDDTGEDPGAIVMSRRVLRAMANAPQFRTNIITGGSRPANARELADVIEAANLPPIVQYNRRVKVNGATVKVLADDSFFLLPAPVATDDWQATELGATFWGRTLTSTDASWEIEDSEQPGIVAGVYKNEKPPMGAEVIADAIGLPVLANADLSFKMRVL